MLHRTDVIARTNIEMAYSFATQAPEGLRRMAPADIEAWIVQAMDVYDRMDLFPACKVFLEAEYRVIFFAKPEELAALPARPSELAAHMPLKVAIFSERDTTLLSTDNPQTLRQFFLRAGLDAVFERWHTDVSTIFDSVSHAE